MKAKKKPQLKPGRVPKNIDDRLDRLGRVWGCQAGGVGPAIDETPLDMYEEVRKDLG